MMGFTVSLRVPVRGPISGFYTLSMRLVCLVSGHGISGIRF